MEREGQTLQDRKIKVLHVIHSLSLGDGITQVVGTITRHIDREKFTVAICCLAGRGNAADEFERAGIKVFSLGAKSSISPVRFPQNLYATCRLARLLQDEEIDVLHTHEFFSGTLGRIAGWLARVPVIILMLHNRDAWKRRFHILIDRCLVKVTDRIVTNSEAVRDFAIKHEHAILV